MDDNMTERTDENVRLKPAKYAGQYQYKGLGRLLHIVRWMQHLLAIIAEALILLSFAMSGMDVSLGGVMASVSWLKILWAAMFALGIDTAFALSWVRVRQHLVQRQWGSFTWNLILAFCMSFIVFEPIAIQLLQQSLSLDFSQAVDALGINIVLLTYARSGVAVFLGAILAMTNVESSTPAQTALPPTQPKRQFIQIEQLFQEAEPIVPSNDTVPTQPLPIVMNEEHMALEPVVPTNEPEAPIESSVTTEDSAAARDVAPEQQAETPAQPELPRYDTPEQRAQKVSEIDLNGMSSYERVANVLSLFPYVSDRELGRLSKLSAATAKKHKEALQRKQSSKKVIEQDGNATELS